MDVQALFRALKTKHDTPKYGLIYHASLVGQVDSLPRHSQFGNYSTHAQYALSQHESQHMETHM